MPSPATPPLPPLPAHSQVRIGHVHLKVAELERALAFYRDVLGFAVTQRYGRQAVFLSVGGYHHHLGLNTWESAGGPPPPAGTTGLYHVAFLYPTRAELADDGIAAAGVVQRGKHGNGRGLARAVWPQQAENFAFFNVE